MKCLSTLAVCLFAAVFLLAQSWAKVSASENDEIKIGADDDNVTFWATDQRFKCFGTTLSLKFESELDRQVALKDLSISDSAGVIDLSPMAKDEFRKFRRVTIVQPTCRRSDQSIQVFLLGSHLGELDGKPARRVLAMSMFLRKDANAPMGWSLRFSDVTEKR